MRPALPVEAFTPTLSSPIKGEECAFGKAGRFIKFRSLGTKLSG
jgi:hypothetical protein